MEEEVRSGEERREEQAVGDRRYLQVAGENQEMRAVLETTERARKTLEAELQEVTEKCCLLNSQVRVSRGVKPQVHHEGGALAPALGWALETACVMFTSTYSCRTYVFMFASIFLCVLVHIHVYQYALMVLVLLICTST